MHTLLYIRIIAFLFVFSLLNVTVNAQQKLVTINGNIQEITVISYGEAQLTYTNQQTGQRQSVSFDDIMMIVFEDGTTDVFNRADRNTTRQAGSLAVQQDEPQQKPVEEQDSRQLESSSEYATVLISADRPGLTAYLVSEFGEVQDMPFTNSDDAYSAYFSDVSPGVYFYVIMNGDEVKEEGQMILSDGDNYTADLNIAEDSEDVAETQSNQALLAEQPELSEQPEQITTEPAIDSYQQGISAYGLNAGLNYGSMIGDVSAEPIFGIHAGGFIRYNMRPKINLEIGLNVTQRGYSYWEWPNEIKTNLTYFTVPILYSYNFAKNDFSLSAGINLSYLLKATIHDFENNRAVTRTGRNMFNNWNLGTTIGINYKINQAIKLRSSYNIGLTNIYEEEYPFATQSAMKFGILYTL